VQDEESDEELSSLNDVFAKQQKQKEAKEKAEREEAAKKEQRARLQARKLAAMALATKAAAASDSDSDIEIEGAPGAIKKASPVKARRSKFDVFAQVKNEAPNPHAAVHKMLRNVAGIDTSHVETEEDDPSQSQMEAAGKNFGHHLDPNLEYAGTPSKASKKRSTRRKTDIDHDHLNSSLLRNAKMANLEARREKATEYRQKQAATVANPELAGVDVKKMLERKKEREKEDDAMDFEEEMAEDGDYRDSAAEDEEDASAGSGEDDEFALASGSDVPSGQDGRKKGEHEEDEDEGEVDSEGELRMPPSSQNSDRFGRAEAVEEEEEEESMMPPPTSRGKKPRIVEDDDEETQETVSTSTTPAPTEIVPSAPPAIAGRVALDGLFGGDDVGGGGFSQFFDSQFSQDAGGDGAAEVRLFPLPSPPFRAKLTLFSLFQDGFLRPNHDDLELPAATMFVGQPLISTAERAADVARLEARGGFNVFEPGTPREVPAARQYINQQGCASSTPTSFPPSPELTPLFSSLSFLTQTRPANLFADSPSDSPAFAFRHSLSTRDSESQLGGDPQTQTPTQVSKNPTKLRRLEAMVTYGDLPPTEPATTAATRPASEEVAETQDAEETQEETQDHFPSAAQQPTAKNAFDVLKEGAAPPAATPAPKKKRPTKSAYVDDQANLSDEEQLGLGGISGDEDETNLDDELDGLVDNEEVDRELRDEQDAAVDELHACVRISFFFPALSSLELH
jgi:hypothetical protein